MQRGANLPHSSKAWIHTHFSLQELEEGMGLVGKKYQNQNKNKQPNQTNSKQNQTKTMKQKSPQKL